MSAPGTPKASQAAITAVQEALGAMNIVGPMRRIFQDDEMADALGVLLAQEIEAVAVAAADAAAPHDAAQALRDAADVGDEDHMTDIALGGIVYVIDWLRRRADRLETGQ